MDTLIPMIDGLSANNGDHPAVLAFRKEGLETRTFLDLEVSVKHLCRGILEAGLSPGDTVGFMAAPKPDWITACLAVIRAGGVVAPLDTQLTGDALAKVLEDCAPRWVFADGSRADHLEKARGKSAFEIILLDGDGQDGRRVLGDLEQENGDAGSPARQPEDPAALFYTSGTTGPPKGVPLTHRNIAFQLDSLLQTGLVRRKDRMVLPLPLHHVYPFVIGMLAPLTFGVPLIIPLSLTGPEILRAVREGKGTILLGVPRLYEALVQGFESRFKSGTARRLFTTAVATSGRLAQRTGIPLGKWLFKPLHKQVGPHLRIAASGGALLDPELARRLEGLGWHVAIGYGLTETSPLLSLAPPGRARADTVGRPIPGVDIRVDLAPVAGEAGERQAAGPVGEIQAKGPSVFPGYRNLPDRTRESFTQGGWFKTGDLGYFDGDGYLHVVGRLSTLIVTDSGEKVQPDEVEEAYAQSPLIREVGIFQREKRLAGVVLPDAAEIRRRGREDIPAAVREEIRALSPRLPSYQQVSDFVITREPLARTRLGKIRRHLLPNRYDREKEREGSDRKDFRPIGRDEMVAEDRELLDDPAAGKVWELLAASYHDRLLTPDTDIRLELGVDSMDWLNLTLEIAERTGVELDDETIGRIETVRELLRETAASGGGPGAASGVSPVEDPDRFLTGGQKHWLEPLNRRMEAIARNLFRLNRFIMTRVFRLKVEGVGHLPGDAPFILTPNHVSYLDPFAIAAALNFDLLRRTYWGGWAGAAFTNPFNRFISRVSQVVPIDPDHAALSSLAFSAAVLERGHNLVWFPEGERSPTGELQPFKTGIGHLLDRFRDCLVVPVLIRGTGEALPPGEFLKGFHPVSLTFGEPLEPRSLAGDASPQEAQDRITRSLQERLAGMKRRHGSDNA